MVDLCKSPDLVAEVTVMAAERLRTDAAILFSDLLLILEPMGLDVCYTEGDGPSIRNPIRDAAGIDRLREVQAVTDLAYLSDAVRRTRAALRPDIPLLGFAGAPFTLAAYAIEGGQSRNYERTKQLLFSDPGAWHALLEKLRQPVSQALQTQIAAGAQAVQIFDSWVGCLGPSDYRTHVLPHVQAILRSLPPDVPVIHFGTGNPALLEAMKEAGGDVMGLDYRVELDEAWERLGSIGVQGNLDPCILLASRQTIEERAGRILAQAAGRPGHIFNLGHGVLPGTPVDNVRALIDYVHERSAR
jgi:uroporphyrinogen decarboxylase